jgi:8-oxo-dGTP diphosphatase
MNDSPKKKSRRPVHAAGGIVVRAGSEPLFAVVQMSKFDSWVLPKGKLMRGETAIEAAQREVMEETGHDVAVHEFVGTLAYEVGGRPKIVQFWRMQALDDAPAHELMRDAKMVDWLPLEGALGRLTHLREREFLGSVGPHVIAATGAPSSSPPERRIMRARAEVGPGNRDASPQERERWRQWFARAYQWLRGLWTGRTRD